MQNPLRLVPVGAIALGVQPWRLAGALRTTLVAKVTLAPGPSGLALAPAEPVRLRDVHWSDDPARSLQDCSDLAPVMPHAEVLLTASAWVPRGGRALVRLGLGRAGQVVLDKQAWVSSSAEPGGPLERVPLTWENALGGPSTPNPVGSQRPRVVGAKSPNEPCGFGPIARYWPSRASLLRPEDKRGLRGEVLELHEAASPRFFQSAPEDQRLASLSGDETVVLDHVHPTLPRLELRLPAVCAWYRVVEADSLGPPVAMRPDLLRIDADRGLVCLTFRAELRDVDGHAPRTLACAAQTSAQPIEWPSAAACAREASPTKSARGKTAAIRMGELGLNTLPFAGGAAPRGEPRAGDAVPLSVGTPWSGPVITAAPIASDPLAGTISIEPPPARGPAPFELAGPSSVVGSSPASMPASVLAPPPASMPGPVSASTPASMLGQQTPAYFAAAPLGPRSVAQPAHAAAPSPPAVTPTPRSSVPLASLPRPPGLDAFELGTLADPFRVDAPPAPRPTEPRGLGHALLVALTSRARELASRPA